GFAECLKQARARSNWDRRRTHRHQASNGRRKGLGVAALAHICGVLGTGAIIRHAVDGSIVLNTGAVEMGQGAGIVLAQSCAEYVRVDVSRVNQVAPDTDAPPYNWGTGASRVTYMAGRAVVGAAAIVKEKIFTHAAAMLECAVQDLELAACGVVGVK